MEREVWIKVAPALLAAIPLLTIPALMFFSWVYDMMRAGGRAKRRCMRKVTHPEDDPDYLIYLRHSGRGADADRIEARATAPGYQAPPNQIVWRGLF